MSKVNLERLNNGLPIISVPVPGTEAVCILILVRVGSRYELKNEQGLSHFLEHMVFKGTKGWPTAEKLTQALDSLGAEYNAFTSKEYTGFYVKAAAEHLDIALAILKDMVWQPLFNKEETEREKKVIVEEIKMYEDNPLLYIGDVLENALFRGSSLGISIAGSKESVMALTHKQLTDFWKNHYWPRNMLAVVAGKLDKPAVAKIRRNFTASRPQGVTSKFKNFVPNPKKAQVALHFKDTQQIQLALGFPAFGWGNSLNLALEVLATILGGNMSSRLFMRLREKEGLCYSVRTTSESFYGTGLFTVQAGLDQARLPLAIKLIKEELNKVVSEPVGKDEIKKAKDYIKGRLTLALEDSSSQAEWVGRRYFLENTIESVDKYKQRLDKITAHDLQKVAKEVIKIKSATLALIGPFRNAEQWRKLLK